MLIAGLMMAAQSENFHFATFPFTCTACIIITNSRPYRTPGRGMGVEARTGRGEGGKGAGVGG